MSVRFAVPMGGKSFWQDMAATTPGDATSTRIASISPRLWKHLWQTAESEFTGPPYWCEKRKGAEGIMRMQYIRQSALFLERQAKEPVVHQP
eukprot:CAMPEP_0172467504 /NCGR_PEP_ID=MMETSP1065-20121228/59121_1 /TAXON_ID=265537 /ORGANISM="Amphiprora paludosa, Strain CCMP125" /LENGTH=91 /DNA_ID=CAMNT_0013224665 /DNA_START=370 /DNA_END=645 /DNA_ORIENTATION=+